MSEAAELPVGYRAIPFAPGLTEIVGPGLWLWKKTWIVGSGTVLQHYRFRLLGGSQVREFRGARGFAIIHAVWKNGWGSSDELVLLTEGNERIQIHAVQNQYESLSADKPGPIESVVLGLGRYLSWRSGLPLSVREYGISPPSD